LSRTVRLRFIGASNNVFSKFILSFLGFGLGLVLGLDFDFGFGLVSGFSFIGNFFGLICGYDNVLTKSILSIVYNS